MRSWPLYILLTVLLFGLVPTGATANEFEAASRLYSHHQSQTMDVARKLQALREQFNGHLDQAPATLVVPLIDKAVAHMRWAKAYAPDNNSREILEFNARNLKVLRQEILKKQGQKPKPSNSCSGDDSWITA